MTKICLANVTLLVGFFVATIFSGVECVAQRSDHAPKAGCKARSRLTLEQFRAVMETVSSGWNSGNARMAASCFSVDATYSAPPSTPHEGRRALYEFFGGAKGRDLPMHMVWHNVLFDPIQQIGIGEYTFKYRIQTHGLVIVKTSQGLIKNWREYEVESELPWNEFVGSNQF